MRWVHFHEVTYSRTAVTLNLTGLLDKWAGLIAATGKQSRNNYGGMTKGQIAGRIGQGGYSLGSEQGKKLIVQSRWPSWVVRPNEPSGFRGRKAISNHASALVSARR